ncbi:MAG: hypothetical protein HQK93_10240, partial [Nitrospirae bacterium]|nr:hypothetical protein [Nitrospirota bacterium]
MKKQNLFFSLMLFLIFVIPVYTASGASESENILDISAMLTNLNYREIQSGMVIDSEKGTIPGIELSFSHQPSSSILFLRGITNLSYGSLDYNGGTWGGTALAFSHNSTLFNLEGDIGLCIGSKKILILYSGVGHTFWNRGMSNSTPGDYDEHYSLYYLPVGVILNIKQDGDLSFSIHASLRYMFSGTVPAFFSGINPGFNDVALNL